MDTDEDIIYQSISFNETSDEEIIQVRKVFRGFYEVVQKGHDGRT